MARSVSRTQFLRGDIRGVRAPLRPPWAVSEAEFVELCTRCDDCLRACPEKILIRGPGGFPAVDFSRGECTFCHACADYCRPGVLYFQPNLKPWQVTIQISDACLAKQGVVCLTCAEQCEVRAITMQHQEGWVAMPMVNPITCTGCGACVKPCPTHAVQVVRIQHAGQTETEQESL